MFHFFSRAARGSRSKPAASPAQPVSPAPVPPSRLTIEFGQGDTDACYLGPGWVRNSPDARWSFGRESEIWLNHPGTPRDRILELDLSTETAQRFSVLLRKTIIGRAVVEGRTTLSFPAEAALFAAPGPIRLRLQHNPLQGAGGKPQKKSIRLHRLTLGESDGTAICNPTGGLSPAALERALNMPASDFIRRFESMGDNCEFGFVQAVCGAEPVGLFRFGAPPLHRLIWCLQNRLEGIGELDNIELYLDNEPPEYWVHEKHADMRYHTFIFPHEHPEGIDQERIRRQQSQRLRLLSRKFLEDLEAGEKIFVCKKSFAPTTDAELIALHDAMSTYAANTLLWIEPSDTDHPSGTVEILRPGLLKGFTHRFWQDTDQLETDVDAWLSVCLNAFQIHQGREVRNPAPRPRSPAMQEALVAAMTLDAVGHVANVGDISARPDGWVGRPGSGFHMEGFMVKEDPVLPFLDLTYRTIGADGAMSAPCGVAAYSGTRGQLKPIHGFAINLAPSLASMAELTWEARFIDGSEAGPSPSSKICKANSGSALEAIRLTLKPLSAERAA